MVGDKLRQERQRQNLTVKDIEQATSIRGLYIECIEKGDYGQLPGDVYTKGFIRNYANFLKLDADACVQQYVEETNPEKAAAQEAARAARAAQEARAEEEYNGVPFSTGDDFHARVERNHSRQNTGLIAFICLAVAGGAYFMLSSDATPEKPAVQQTQQGRPVKQAQQAKKSDTKPAVQQEKAASQENTVAAAAKPAGDVEVSASFTDRCWTQVIADGQTLFEGTMEAGKTMNWKGKEKVVLIAGNAGAVEITVNGQSQGKVGELGQVVERTFTKEGDAPAQADDGKQNKQAQQKGQKR